MDFAAARRNMVDSQVRPSDVTNKAIQDAMFVIERERFCAPSRSFSAYSDSPCLIAPGRSLMPAREVGKLLQVLDPKPGERALALAAPYAAAVLVHMGLEVEAQESDPVVADILAPAMETAGVRLHAASLNEPIGEGFDLIISEGAVADIPASWIAALKLGGRMAIVERDGPIGHAVLLVRSGESSESRHTIFNASPEVLPGFTRQPIFVL